MKNKTISNSMCIRIGMPETNSSSSHSITIFGGRYCDKDTLSYIISKDGKTVTIPGGGEFGRNDGDYYNDPVEKLKYASALFFDCEGVERNLEYREIFEKVIKDFTGVEQVNYAWKIYKDENEVPELFDNEEIIGEDYEAPNEIDHSSVDYAEEILFESEQVMKDFLFGVDSWISCGECDVMTPDRLFPNTIGKDFVSYNTLTLKESDKIKFDNYIKEVTFSFSQRLKPISEYKTIKYNCSNYLSEDVPLWLRLINFGIHVDWFSGEIGCDEAMIDLSSIKKLESMYLLKDSDGIYRLNWGDSKNILSYEDVYVPLITEDTFRYPFELIFINKDKIYKKEEKDKNKVIREILRADDKVRYIKTVLKDYIITELQFSSEEDGVIFENL